MPADPLDDARALLLLARLLYRSRAPARAGALRPLGVRLAGAVADAERAPEGSPERKEALERVAAAGVELWASVDDRGEGIRQLLGVVIAGVRGSKLTRGLRS